MSSNRAPGGRFASRICWDNEMGLLLYLDNRQTSLSSEAAPHMTHLSVYWSLLTPNFWQASSRTSVRYLTGVVGILTVFAYELNTVT
jgi:hypothetical protein